jgi:hypothetical protein
MIGLTLGDLQESVRDKSAFKKLDDYLIVGRAVLGLVQQERPTRIVSPSHANYIFYQYDQDYGHKITRPLNTDLFVELAADFEQAFGRFVDFLGSLRKYRAAACDQGRNRPYIEANEINRMVYTLQQGIGCISDSFEDTNQSRKRAGQLFETLIKLILQEVGVECEPRTINIPIPDNPGYAMSYQLDLVFSRNKAILTSETKFIHPHEIVGSVKTTSKDRIDKVLLDKYLLTKLLGRDIPVVAVFLHDVQRARRGNSIFGINTTFKSNHFLGYTVALNRLDGVYYVDPRPEMLANPRLREQIFDFPRFLIRDLWTLTNGEPSREMVG